MLHNEFQKLSDREKYECLWEKGTPVAGYDSLNKRYVLYQLDGFYVEAEYRTDFIEIVAVKAIEARDLPEVYLKQVNISGLEH